VTYTGNAGTNNVAAGPNYSLAINVPGSQIFSAAGADMFQAISDLIGALQSNTGIANAAGEVSKAFEHITGQRCSTATR